MLPVFLHRGPRAENPGESHVQVALAADLAGERGAGRLDATSAIALRKEGPFRPIGEALTASASLREAFAEACALPAAAAYRRTRAWLFLALIPLLMLAELDRELLTVRIDGAGVRLACDLFLVVAVAADLARSLPRHPRTTAIVLFGAAARFTLFIAKACGRGVHPAIALAATLALGAAVLVWTRSPTPRTVTRAILATLAIDPARAEPLVTRAPPRVPLLSIAALAALGLPIMLAAAARYGIGLWPRAVLYAAYAAFVPMAIERALESRARRPAPFPWHIALAAAAAFALSLGLTNGVHFGADAVAYAARCVSPAPAAGAAQRLLDAEAYEVARNLKQARMEWAFFAMNVAVVPLAEERVYRDFFQRILARRFGRTVAIASASSVFALAHLDVYRVAIYQIVPLGIACGLAYEEGGLIAAAITHALWNLHLLL
jgi:membrane protease YdiL (CAAX protease family)